MHLAAKSYCASKKCTKKSFHYKNQPTRSRFIGIMVCMYVVREIIYAFLLVALLHSIVLCFNELNTLLDDNGELFAQAYQLHRCGRLLAARENLHASIATIHYYRPKLPAASRAKLAAAMRNFYHNYPLASCAEVVTQIEVYRHANDQLPEFWPNYVFRLHTKKP